MFVHRTSFGQFDELWFVSYFHSGGWVLLCKAAYHGWRLFPHSCAARKHILVWPCVLAGVSVLSHSPSQGRWCWSNCSHPDDLGRQWKMATWVQPALFGGWQHGSHRVVLGGGTGPWRVLWHQSWDDQPCHHWSASGTVENVHSYWTLLWR